MNLNRIRRLIVYEAGGGRKLGAFSWAAAIFGAVALLLAVGAVFVSWISGL